MKTYLFLLITCVLTPFLSNSQTKTRINDLQKLGEFDWSNDNYKLSVVSYEKLMAVDSKNSEYAYRFGVSNYLAGFDPDKSLKALEPLIGKPEAPVDVSYWVAQVYMSLYEFVDAIDMFRTYIASSGISEARLKESNRFIEMCQSAIELVNKPVNVFFENLGPNINSSSHDFNPFIPENEEFIVFSSEKKFDEESGMFDQNMYISYPEKGGWSFAKPLLMVNTEDNEKTVGLTPDGKKLFVCGNFAKLYSDVNVAVLKGKSFKYDPENKMFDGIGNKFTTGASMTSDGNTVYFSAYREDSKGDGDIYYMRMLPNATWGKPKNLSDVINTSYDEIYPTISPDGNILYFSSKGHNSMGGYDLFVSYLNEITGEWTKPLNVGYPINTPGDDFIISFSKDRRYAYTSSIRKEGIGGHDIYRITFKDVEEPLTVVKGKIKFSDGTVKTDWHKTNEYLDISIYDSHQNLFGKYIYNTTLNRFVSALPTGTYKIVIQAEGYQEYSENIDVLDRNLYQPEVEKEFLLLQKK
jgi:hypothetical protein